MTTPEEFIDDALYLVPGEQVEPLVWPRPFRAKISRPLRVSPVPGEKGKPKKTTDRRYEWRPQEPVYLITTDGTPLGPMDPDQKIEDIPFTLTTKSPDAAKKGKTLNNRARRATDRH